MKKYILGVVFTLMLYFYIYSVRAYDIDVEGSGQVGKTSLNCNTGNCINSLDFIIKDGADTYTFLNTAIYGMRLTVLTKKNGNTIKGPINYWATSSMSEINNKNIFVKKYKYTNKVDPTGTLWKKTYLRTLESSEGTYSSYLDSLTSDDFVKLLEGMGITKNEISTYVEGKYALKIEPIFVVRHYYYGDTTYYSGTAKEIVNMLYDKGCDGAVMVLNSNGFHVVTNYLTTIYDDSDGAPDLNVDKYVTSNRCYSGYHRQIYGGGDPNDKLGVGYINLKDRINNDDHRVIQVCKRLGKNDDDAGWFSAPVKFILYEKGKDTDKKIGEATTNPANNKFCVSFDIEYKYSATNYGSNKKYYIREILPNNKNDFNKVEFYTKAPFDNSVGSYSSQIGKAERGATSWGSVDYADSNPFIPVLGSSKKYYIMVWNNIETGTGKLKISKYAGNGIDLKKNFNYQTDFRLYFTDKSDSDCSGAKKTGEYIAVTKEFYKDSVSIDKLSSGCYILAEENMTFHKNFHGVKKVHFFLKNEKFGDSIELNSDVEEIFSEPFYIQNDKTKEIVVYNDEDNGDTNSCASKLKNIKDDYSVNKDSVTAIKNLKELYEYMYNNFGKQYNMLFNYNPMDAVNKNNSLLDNVTCGQIYCDYKHSPNIITDSSLPSDNTFSCSSGYFEYGVNTKLDSSNNISVSKSIMFDPSVSEDEKNQIQNNVNNKTFKFYQTTCDYGSKIDYYSGATCGVSYEYNNNTFKDVKLESGQLLWGKGVYDNNVGFFKLKLRCYYSGSNYLNGLHNIDENNIINDYLPYGYVNLVVLAVGDNLHTSVSSSSSESNFVTIDNNNYYLYKTSEFTLPIQYNTLRYLSPYTGIFSSKTLDNYFPAGYGLPIKVDAKSGNYTANLTLNLLSPAKEFKTTCNFSIKNNILSPPNDPNDPNDPDDPDEPVNNNFNFSFRIIDTTNPFPGIDGEGRTTGDNWCADSRIGKKVKDEDGKEFLVGDINGDGFINEEDFEVSDFTMKPSLVADIDGDGEVTDATNIVHCNDEMTDRCILKRYVLNTSQNPYRNYNCSFDSNKNYIVKNYITGDADYKVENSYSNNQPMYSFTLTPSDIKDIRSYNKKISYINENGLKIDEDGNYLSDFITENLNKLLNKTTSRCYELRRNNKWCSNN